MSDESFRPKNPPSPAKSRSKTHSSPAKSASSLTSSPQRVQVQEASGRLDNSALLIKRLKDAYGYYFFPLSHLRLSIHIEYEHTYTLCSFMKNCHHHKQKHTIQTQYARFCCEVPRGYPYALRPAKGT